MPQKTVTLFEHQSLAYDSEDIFPQKPAARERLLDAIERINTASGQEILHIGRKALRANSLVGILRVGDLTFEILPKIDGQPPGQPPKERSAAQNLLTMLDYASGLRIHQQEIAALDSGPSSWFELLTRLFAADLFHQVQIGLPQAYVTRHERLPVLRGRWDVQQQLSRHPGENDRFSVIYDDLTGDTLLAQVFRFTVERLLPLTTDPENRRILGIVRGWLAPVTLLPEIPAALLDRVSFNRLNERCRPVFELARLFLSAYAPRMTAGSTPVMAFLFDMNMLFERFVAGFLERHRSSLLPDTWQEASIHVQSERMPLYLARSDGKSVFRLRPDLLLTARGGNTPLLVIDTKYKQIQAARSRLEIAPDDVYQMLAYGVRLKAQRLLLLYPQAAGANPICRPYDIENATARLFVATINLHAPLNDPAALIAELRAILSTTAA